MTDNYAKIVHENHKRLFENPNPDLARLLSAQRTNAGIEFSAFGETCRIDETGFFLNGSRQEGVLGILLSLYALHAHSEPCRLEPFKAYKEFPGTMPYAGAFTTHTEHILMPHVKAIRASIQMITSCFAGRIPDPSPGDFSFIVFPLPKLALCYIFYEEDEEFPPSVSCLYSNNASGFMPNDALADVGEYTSKKIISLVETA